MATYNAFDQFQMLLREQMGGVVLRMDRPEDDPVWSLMDTFNAETRAGRRTPTASGSAIDYPEGYEASYKIKVQRGGRVSAGTFKGNTMVMMGKESHLAMGQAADAKYLDPRKTPLAAYITILLVLKRILGSLTKNQSQIIAELATRPVDEVAGDAMLDATDAIRSYIVNYFYGDGTGALALVNGAGQTVVETAGGSTSIAIDGGSWGRFNVGDLVQFAGYSAGTYTQRLGSGGLSTGYGRIVTVDGNNRNIKIQAEPGEGTISLTDNDLILLAGTVDFATNTSLVPNGIENTIIASGVYPGSITPWAPSGLDVAYHTALMGMVTGTDGPNEDPTMSALTELLDNITQQGHNAPRAMIAEQGIWTLFAQIERDNHVSVQVPMGVTFTAAGGVAGPILSHMEDRFQRFTSIRVRPNCILGMDPPTWRKFIPLGDRTIRWIYGSGPLSGIQSIYGPVYDGVQLTELADAPFECAIELGCVDPKSNLRRLGMKAQRDV